MEIFKNNNLNYINKSIAALLVAVAMVFIYSCRKDIAESDMDFVGTWTGGYTVLEIRENGKGNYDYNDGSTTKQVHGKVKIKGNVMRFSFMGIAKKYTIDKRPETTSNGTIMVLDGEFFKKQ